MNRICPSIPYRATLGHEARASSNKPLAGWSGFYRVGTILHTWENFRVRTTMIASYGHRVDTLVLGVFGIGDQRSSLHLANCKMPPMRCASLLFEPDLYQSFRFTSHERLQPRRLLLLLRTATALTLLILRLAALQIFSDPILYAS